MVFKHTHQQAKRTHTHSVGRYMKNMKGIEYNIILLYN